MGISIALCVPTRRPQLTLADRALLAGRQIRARQDPDAFAPLATTGVRQAR
jgi:hypothetical protein